MTFPLRLLSCLLLALCFGCSGAKGTVSLSPPAAGNASTPAIRTGGPLAYGDVLSIRV